ncbi:MAG: hypothetical protein PHV98_07450, partial [Candidatus Omnitrophica bacterium]|nr:hypothetical protein [Candidatus Omnitrophota bacterium]
LAMKEIILKAAETKGNFSPYKLDNTLGIACTRMTIISKPQKNQKYFFVASQPKTIALPLEKFSTGTALLT